LIIIWVNLVNHTIINYTMSQYSRHLASFLARTYYPVTVSFKSTPLQYSNPLFSVSHRINTSKYTDNNCETGYIQFESALNKYHKSQYCNNNKLNTPESFIKYMLDKPTKYTSFELVKKNDNIVEFNTNGNIPLRYLDMINDFTPYKFEYKKPTKTDIKLYETELYETKIAYVNSDTLYDIYQYARYLSEKDRILKIVVTKAPAYPFDKDFLKKYNFGTLGTSPARSLNGEGTLGTSPARSLNGEGTLGTSPARSLNGEGTFRQEESDEYIQQSLKEREWKSGDGDFSSVPTKIFFNRTMKFKSLNNIGYNKLFSSSGGIDFSYCRELPWFNLKNKMGELISYYDISGREEYYSTSDNIGTTEFVIFSEALAKEGAEYTLEY